MSADPGFFAAVFVTLFAAHQVGDHWLQTDDQAGCKGMPGRIGAGYCVRHVVSLTAAKVLALVVLMAVTGTVGHPVALVAGLVMDAVSHYWIDRRFTLAALVARCGWLSGFIRLGRPRPGRDDNPSLGTGAYALDQSWHIGWLFVAALIIAL